MNDTASGVQSETSTLISVVIITYNGDSYIAKAVKSVLAQTHRNLELIVVEDGSRGRTAEIVAAFKDERVRYIWQPNGGLSAARNTGIRNSSGAFVAFLDCDDWWRPEKLQRQWKALVNHPHASFAFSSAVFVNDRAEVLKELRAGTSRCDLASILLGNVVSGSASSVMTRRTVLAAAGGFDMAVSHAEDWECWIRLSAKGDGLPVDSSDVYILVREDSFGRNTAKLRDCSISFLDVAFATFARDLKHLRSSALANVHYTASINFTDAGRRAEAFREVCKATWHSPLRIIHWKRLVLLLAHRL